MILSTLVTSQLHFEMCAGLYGHPVLLKSSKSLELQMNSRDGECLKVVLKIKNPLSCQCRIQNHQTVQRSIHLQIVAINFASNGSLSIQNISPNW